MTFMARALSLAGLLTTVTCQEYQAVTPLVAGTVGDNPTCAQMATAGQWQDLTEAQCRQYVQQTAGATFVGTGVGVSQEIPCGCTTADFNNNQYYYTPCTTGVPTGSEEYHHICVKTVTCQSMTCLERFLYWCQQSTVGFGSNNNVAAANSPRDILVAECPDCNGAASTDTCPTNLYDAAPEEEPTSELDKTSVAVSVPIGLVSALAAVGAVVGVSRRRASNQPVLVEDEQDLLRE
ncbi:unnamed protein product [Prorocentrum cordatum]|uniref:Uncharacterized protein n=1 Tax=Prorocentrum cordatum TaxID=2364126 RepID=A0ABN9VF03_9DINO|nr:unnamed protein product [Polarella glacialis]